jgi:DNA-binding CsgD family transcriptional regulator
MPPARSITAVDMQSAYRLVGDCRDLGDDCPAWQQRLMDRLRVVLGAQVVIIGNTLDFRPGATPRSVSVMRSGWRDADAERAWMTYASSVPLTRTPEFTRVAGRANPQLTLTRDDIWDPVSWYRSQTFNERHRLSGIDHYMMSIHAVPRWDLSHSIWVHRAVGEKPFTRRDRDLLQIVHAEVGRYIGGPLASAVEPGSGGLTPRQRSVLARLLQGDSEKQAAARLGISTATLHEHVATVYKHFQVVSRPELMAKFIGRGLPPHFTPDPEPARTSTSTAPSKQRG